MENRDIAPRQRSPRFLDDDGEMGERIRTFDWCTTPLGKPKRWLQALRTLVNLLLVSNTTVEFGDQAACRCGVVSSDRAWRRLDAGVATMTRPGRVRGSGRRAVAGG